MSAESKEMLLLSASRHHEAASRAILSDVFKLFLTSKRYSTWLKQELELKEFETSLSGLGKVLERAGECDMGSLQHLIQSRTNLLLPNHGPMLNSTWFEYFAGVMDGLPICVYLTIPDRSMRFPMLYANAFTSTFSGYSPSDLFGAPNLYFDQLTDGVMELMLSALPAHCKLNSVDISGVETPSLLLCIPLFDRSCEYKCIVNFQTSSFDDDVIMKSLFDLITMLPSII
jgi:hypothetical protein